MGSLNSLEFIDNALSNQDKDKYELEPKVKNIEIYDETRESILRTQGMNNAKIGILKITMKKLGI